MADLSYARQMIIFSRVSAKAFLGLFFSRVSAIILFWCFLVFWGVFFRVFFGAFGGVFVCFSRVSANFFVGFFFRAQPSKPGIPALSHGRIWPRPLPREAKQEFPLPGLSFPPWPTWGLAEINKAEFRAVLFGLDPTGSQASKTKYFRGFRWGCVRLTPTRRRRPRLWCFSTTKVPVVPRSKASTGGVAYETPLSEPIPAPSHGWCRRAAEARRLAWLR